MKAMIISLILLLFYSCHLSEDVKMSEKMLGGMDPLAMAIKNGDIPNVLLALKDQKTYPVEKPYALYALLNKKVHIFKVLREHGFTLVYQDECLNDICVNYEPIPFAIKYKLGINVIDQLVGMGFDIDTNIGRRGETSLHLVSKNCDADVADYLLKRGAETDVYNIDGRSPLHLASMANCIRVVHSLIRFNAFTKKEDKSKRLAIDYTTNPDIRWIIEHKN